MKATLKIGEGSLTITGKDISLEIDSDSTTHKLEAQAKLNFAQAANTAARTAADANHPITKLVTSIGEDILKTKKAKDEKGTGAAAPAAENATAATTRQPYTGARRGRKAAAKKAAVKKSAKKK